MSRVASVNASALMDGNCTRCGYCDNNGACPTIRYREEDMDNEGVRGVDKKGARGGDDRDRRVKKREIARVVAFDLPVLLRNKKGAVRDVHSPR